MYMHSILLYVLLLLLEISVEEVLCTVCCKRSIYLIFICVDLRKLTSTKYIIYVYFILL